MDKKSQKRVIGVTSAIIDAIAVVAASFTAFTIVFGADIPDKYSAFLLEALLVVVPLRVLAFYMFRFYDGSLRKTGFDIFVNSVKACNISSIGIIAVLYFFDMGYDPRSVAVLSWLMSILYVNFWRYAFRRGGSIFGPAGLFRTRVLIIGTGEIASEIAMRTLMDASISYELAGFIGTGGKLSPKVKKSRMIGGLENLPFLLREHSIDEVIIADESLTKKQISDLMSLLSWEGIALKTAPAAYESIIGNMVLYESGVPFLGPTFAVRTTPSWYWGFKRISDTVIASALIILTSPVMLMAAALIKATSPGPALYFQKRTGLNGKPFVMYKFRTMRPDAEKDNKPRWASADDARIIPAGRLLRRLRIDELPQLVNVIKNDMSLIGPRPERPYFTWKLMRKIPFYAQRLQAKPGLSGWAQVNYQYTDTEKGAREKLLYDLFYIQNASLALDFLILLRTLKVVLTGHGAH